jgi:hypothetical protein
VVRDVNGQSKRGWSEALSQPLRGKLGEIDPLVEEHGNTSELRDRFRVPLPKQPCSPRD